MKYTELKECIACGGTHLKPTLDLGKQPLANSYRRTPHELEHKFPLAIQTCEDCWHTQLTVSVDPEVLFKDYLYVSGTSQTQLNYFEKFAKMTLDHAQVPMARVLDIGCNDGSQLDAYKRLGHQTMGIDPAENLFEESSKKHHIVCDFLKPEHKSLGQFDIIICQNAFAHNTDQLGFLNIVKDMLKPSGSLYITTSQADMIVNNEFDTIYHEHLSFYTVKSMKTLVERAGLNLASVQTNPIHGTSYVFEIQNLPIYGTTTDKIEAWLQREEQLGLYKEETYKKYAETCIKRGEALKSYLEEMRVKGIPVIGVGAAAKGNTLLNFIDFKPDFIIDENPLKHDRLSPGVMSPIKPMSELSQYSFIESLCIVPLAWNFFDELKAKVKAKRRGFSDVYVKYFPNFETSN